MDVGFDNICLLEKCCGKSLLLQVQITKFGDEQSSLFIGSPGCLAVASTILDLANALFDEVASRSRYC